MRFMPSAPPSSSSRPGLTRFERITRCYDDEIYPIFDHWFTLPLVAALRGPELAKTQWKTARVLDFGAGAGHLTAAFAASKPATAVAVEPSGAMLSLLRNNEAATAVSTMVRAGAPATPLPFANNSFDVVLGRARADAGVDPWLSRAELLRVCRPGGRLALCCALSDTWREPLELLNETLQKHGHQGARESLRAYKNRFPAADAVATQLQKEGWTVKDVMVTHKQVLFRSGREFFFSSLIELGPLRIWKALVGKGEPLQAVFADVKDAIDTYYAGRPFAVTVGIATITGNKPKQP